MTTIRPPFPFRSISGKDPYQKVDGEDQYFPMPSLGYVHTAAGSPWSFGVGVYAQGGMGVDFQDVRTPYGTEDEMTSEVAFMRVNPLAAYKVNEDLPLGATVMIGYAMAKFSLFPDTLGQGAGLDVEDLESFGFAGRVGFQYRLGPQWRIGATYTSESAIELEDGTATLNTPMGKVDYDAELDDFTWPQEVEFGVAWMPIKGLTVAADVRWINWSATIDEPKLKLSSPNNPQMPQSMEIAFPMDWDDQWDS